MTTFYPRYGEGRDRVEPVRSTFPTMFQEVIPRYYLSATDTRDDGVGPVFEEVYYTPPRHRKKISPSRTMAAQVPQKRRKRKIRIDFSI